MKDFDPKWKDFPDYILGITHEIWEERKVETLLHYYAPDLIVRSPASVVIGNKAVIEATHATLHEFPDRQLLGEDVIWCEGADGGMLSSHRIFSTATHLNDGAYGPATGKRLRYRVIADCHAIRNQINDEWLIRDQGAIAKQLGFTPKDFTEAQILQEGGKDQARPAFTPAQDQRGPYEGTGNDHALGQALADLLRALSKGNMAVIKEKYDRAAHLEYPNGESAHGHEGAENFWQSFSDNFSNPKFEIDHKIGREDDQMPPRAAVRWSLSGKHDKEGSLGSPSGADIYVMGITHAEFGPWGLRREYTLFDEMALWRQILMR